MAGEYTNPYRENAYTAAALAGAGAYTAGATIDCSEFSHAAFECSYTRADAAGSVKVKVELSFDKGTTWLQTTTKQLVPGALGAEVVHQLIPDAVEYKPLGAGAYLFAVEAPQLTATRVRIQAAEKGAIGAPGTFGAVCRLSRNT